MLLTIQSHIYINIHNLICVTVSHWLAVSVISDMIDTSEQFTTVSAVFIIIFAFIFAFAVIQMMNFAFKHECVIFSISGSRLHLN